MAAMFVIFVIGPKKPRIWVRFLEAKLKKQEERACHPKNEESTDIEGVECRIFL